MSGPSDRAGRVALVEDDEDLRVSTAQLLTLAGFDVVAFPAAPPALLAIDAEFDGIVVTDVRMPLMSGIELFRILRERDPTLPVVLVTGHADVETAVETIKAGAWDFLSKPFDPDALVAAATRAMAARTLALENRRLRAQAAGGEQAALVGRSPAIARLRDMIPVLADTDIDLLIEGETGTGKELLARAIHRAGRRARHRFVSVACAALPGPAIEDELFATVGDRGIVAAQRGTLFLDDIDQASRGLQGRLTQVIEDRALRGARDVVPIDVRVIATAAEEAQRGPDAIAPGLLYRLAAVRLRMPPLRDRREDVPLLFAHLVDLSANRLRRPVPALTQGARDMLARHDWPGNVRELAHFADRFVLGLDGGSDAASGSDATRPLPERLAAFEREAILSAIAATGGEIGAAIDRLGIPRKTFYYKVQRLGIDLRTLRNQG
ncbi:sigma-54 dependent transcriptional regulator [Sphingomonas sp. 2R-10]|uniref:sigma-54-dependent transcriptional regulator n=1 Tax=Sphingomonas sp. 2R-10 TaxID=3045148 RepID=UPI000F77CBE7|nr:sigma-54 dependent transcriptional regulator [Sphingomonas sp. 2R-10]MDJ0275870.1 sigma-54 dependent transcriptional regulator [Sphingomonas sp. 2R-10]